MLMRHLLRPTLVLSGLTCCFVPAGMAWAFDKPTSRTESFEKQRSALVRELRREGISDERVLQAIGAVPRHVFVPENLRHLAYGNHPLPIGEDQTISQPFVVAYMTELARIQAGMRVLEVGTGSGYQAAILAAMGAEVYTIEIIESLGRHAETLLDELGYARVHVRIGDGYQGWPEHEPFDAIIVTAAPDHIPQPLVDQLAVGGRMVIPVGRYMQWLKLVTKTPDGTSITETLPVRFVPMTGEAETR